MKKIIFLFVLLVLSTFLYSQSINGTVKNSKGEAIGAASITILNSEKHAVADKSGNFVIDLLPGKYLLTVSSVGYSTQVKEVVVTSNHTSETTFTLIEEGKQLDEVVVTAEKVESNLQQTPIAITSLSSKKIQEYRIWNVSDLTALAPSAYTVEHGNSTSATFLNIRGAMGFTNEQSVATYVDGVYQFEFFSAPLNFNNIEKIEILRGPQGTLYGRNAFSGVVNVFTKKPSNKTNGFASIDFGNYGQQRYSLGFNTPLIDNKLFFSVGFQLNKRGSIYENPTLNTKDFDSRKSINGNFSLKYLLSDKGTLDFNVRNESNTDKGAYPWVSTDSIARNEPFKAYGNWANTERRTNINEAFSIKYYGNRFNFTSITGAIQYHLWYPDRYDFDFTSAKFYSGNGDAKHNEFTQEFRFSSAAGQRKFKWTAGSFLFLEKTKNVGRTFYEDDFVFIDPTAPYSSITKGKRNNKGLAFFGQATIALSETVDFTFGTRYDVERRQLTQNSSLEKNGVITPLSPDSTFNRTFNAFTPKIVLDFKLSEQSFLYLLYAKGFRIGGFNFNNIADRTYDPERSDNFEIGIKNTFLNNRIKANLIAFYFRQKDQQVSTSKNGIDYAILNVGDMNNFGLEAEVAALPFNNLQLEWTASTSSSKYEKLELFDFATLGVKNYKGNKAIYNPIVQSMLAIQYSIPVNKSKQHMKYFARGEYKYLGEYQLNFENTESQKGYGMVNARIGLESSHLDIAFWARNLNDARYIAWGTFGSYMLGSPRMMGISLVGKL